LNDQGAIQWQKQYSVNGQFTTVRQIIENEDGSFVIAGYYEYLHNAPGNQKLWIIKTDRQGSLDHSCEISVSNTSLHTKGTTTIQNVINLQSTNPGFRVAIAKLKNVITPVFNSSVCGN